MTHWVTICIKNVLCEIKVAVYLCKLPCKVFIHRLSKRNIFWVRGSWFFFSNGPPPAAFHFIKVMAEVDSSKTDEWPLRWLEKIGKIKPRPTGDPKWMDGWINKVDNKDGERLGTHVADTHGTTWSAAACSKPIGWVTSARSGVFLTPTLTTIDARMKWKAHSVFH